MGLKISRMKQKSQNSGNSFKLPIQCVENPEGFGAVVVYNHETIIMTKYHPIPKEDNGVNNPNT